MKNKSAFITDILLFLASAFFCTGTKFIFHACGKKDDGSYMACHWAEQAVFAIGISIVIISLLVLFIKNRKFKAGAAAAHTLGINGCDNPEQHDKSLHDGYYALSFNHAPVCYYSVCNYYNYCGS